MQLLSEVHEARREGEAAERVAVALARLRAAVQETERSDTGA